MKPPRSFAQLFLLLCIGTLTHTPSLSRAADMDEMDLERLMNITVEKVSGASRFEQLLTEAPARMTVITAEEIKRFGHRTLRDVLNSTSGFYTSYDRNYHYIGVRGFSRPGDYNSRILLLVDGHRINDNIYDSATIGTDFMLDLGLVDRIEIIRGPSSTLYGTSAFFGVINVITRNGAQLDGSEISISGGSQNSASGRVTYGTAPPGGGDFLLSASLQISDGERDLYYSEFDSPTTNDGHALRMDDDRGDSFLARATLRDLTLTAAYGRREKRIPTASFGAVFNDRGTISVDSHGYLDLKFERTVGATNILSRLSFDEYRFKGDYVYDLSADGGPSRAVNRDEVLGRWVTGEIQASSLLHKRLHLTGGGEFRGNIRQNQDNYTIETGETAPGNRRRSTFWALFGQAEFRVLDTLLVNGGLRLDQYSTFGGEMSPRLAAIYTPKPQSIFKAVYAQAFRAPNAFELYYTDAWGSFLINPSLGPERVQTAELIYEQYYGTHFRTSLSGFISRFTDLIEYREVEISPGDYRTQFHNVSRVDAKGVEFEMEGRWGSEYTLRCSYTYVEAHDRQHARNLDYSPAHLVKANLAGPVYPRLILAGLEVQAMSKRTFRRLDSGGNEYETRAGGHVVTNLTLSSREIIPGLELSASIYNLLDRRFNDPSTPDHRQELILQDGRLFRFQLTYSF